MVLFHGVWSFPCNSRFFLIYTQSFLVFLASVSMIYGECDLRMKCFACEWLFLFFLCLPTELYIHEGFCCFHAYGWAKVSATENILKGSRSIPIAPIFLIVYFASLTYPFASDVVFVAM